MSVIKFERKPQPIINRETHQISKTDEEVLQIIYEAELRIAYLERKHQREFPTTSTDVNKIPFSEIVNELLESDSGHWLNCPARYKALIHKWKVLRAKMM